MPEEVYSRFFKNLRHEEDIDNLTFKEWKNELQKELENFWESML